MDKNHRVSILYVKELLVTLHIIIENIWGITCQ